MKVRLQGMKQHLELGIIVAMSALMVFATTSYMMPFVYAASSSAARVVLAGKEIMLVVLQQALVQAVLHQRILHPNHAIQAHARALLDITQRTVIITALIEHLDALVQIHTNAQLGQLAQSQSAQRQSAQSQSAQSRLNFFSFSSTIHQGSHFLF